MSSTVLRQRGPGREAHVTNMELFFDLVFVFAIIQLSGHLYDDLTWLGAAETAVMGLALWWAWNYTAWATGWIDPEQTPVMLLLGVLMALSLVMAAAIPDVFVQRGADRAPAFALAYVGVGVLRSAFMIWAFGRGGDRLMRRNYVQLGVWTLIAGVPWVVGALVTTDPQLRLAIWLAAALIDLSAPVHGFWLPGRGHTPMRDWSLAGAHLAERCQLLLMIAFGETILRLGESFARAHEHANVALAFLLGFLTSGALWAVYFTHHAETAARRIHEAEHDAARIGRSGYAFAHMIMVAGVIVLAVAEHMAVVEPNHPVSWGFVLVSAGGPVLYLLGLAWSKRIAGRERVGPVLIGCLAVIALNAAAAPLDQIAGLVADVIVAALLAGSARREGARSDPADLAIRAGGSAAAS